MKKLIILLPTIFPFALYAQIGEQSFIESLNNTYTSGNLYTNKQKEQIVKMILEKDKLKYESGDYMFFPVFDLVFKKLCF